MNWVVGKVNRTRVVFIENDRNKIHRTGIYQYGCSVAFVVKYYISLTFLFLITYFARIIVTCEAQAKLYFSFDNSLILFFWCSGFIFRNYEIVIELNMASKKSVHHTSHVKKYISSWDIKDTTSPRGNNILSSNVSALYYQNKKIIQTRISKQSCDVFNSDVSFPLTVTNDNIILSSGRLKISIFLNRRKSNISSHRHLCR